VRATATIEDSFMCFSRLFPHFSNKMKHQLLRGSYKCYAMELTVSNIFYNLHTCFYGSQATSFFRMPPPSPQQYMANANSGLLVRYHQIPTV
jgi:hypothetical protein